MEISPSFEKWSWIAGIVSAAIALVAFIWQIVFTERSSSRKTDWNVMDKAFHGIRIGAAIQSMYKLGLNLLDRNGAGAIKITKWEQKNGNEMSVTYDSEHDRILYVEVD